MKYRRLRDLREDHDLSQDELGKILNVAQKTYSNYETGKRQIPNEILIRLALFYQTSVDYLLGITDTKVPYPYSVAGNTSSEKISFSNLAIVAEQDTYSSDSRKRKHNKNKDDND